MRKKKKRRATCRSDKQERRGRKAHCANDEGEAVMTTKGAGKCPSRPLASSCGPILRKRVVGPAFPGSRFLAGRCRGCPPPVGRKASAPRIPPPLPHPYSPVPSREKEGGAQQTGKDAWPQRGEGGQRGWKGGRGKTNRLPKGGSCIHIYIHFSF